MTQVSPWIAFREEREGATQRLFCFPFGGGAASAFRDWAKLLPPEIEICPIQYPGRETRIREASITRVETMVEGLSEAMAPFADRPFSFFGHSIGALIAFELTRSLRRAGLRLPEQLIVSGHPAPQLTRRRPSISGLAFPAFVEALRTDFGVDPEILKDRALMEFLFPILRDDYEMVESYAYSPEGPLNLPLHVFGGKQDPETTEEELASWAQQASEVAKPLMFEGNHMFVNTARSAVCKEVGKVLLGAS